MNNPHENTAAAIFLTECMRDLKHRKSQKEIVKEAGFINSNLDRVPALAKALESDPAYLMRLSLEQSVGVFEGVLPTEGSCGRLQIYRLLAIIPSEPDLRSWCPS